MAITAFYPLDIARTKLQGKGLRFLSLSHIVVVFKFVFCVLCISYQTYVFLNNRCWQSKTTRKVGIPSKSFRRFIKMKECKLDMYSCVNDMPIPMFSTDQFSVQVCSAGTKCA